MPFDIEMTGAQDYQRTVKMALCGHPGTGKTLFSSTAPSAFFVFFREQPRIMSIAGRYMPHTKIVNQYDGKGRLTTPVWDTLHEVVTYLDSDRGEPYETVVIDTGDELFQAMKEGRKAANRGKFAIQDWGWLGDMYREVINRIIDLPKHVIVTYHVKSSQEGEDGEIVREIALQGQAKDEVPGWFDIVGVLDSWEEDTESGKILHRGILTHTTPKYGFVKDHSGRLPKVFDLSENFVGDFSRMHDLIYADLPASDHDVIEHVDTPAAAAPPPKERTTAEAGVPTPADVKAKKDSKRKKKEDEPDEEVVAPAEGKGADGEDAEAEPGDSAGTDEAKGAEEQPVPEAAEEADSDAGQAGEAQEEPEVAPAEEPVTEAEAEANVMEAFPGSTVEYATCTVQDDDGNVCGKELVKEDENGDKIPDRDLMDLTMIRFRQHMCREHFTAARKRG